MGLGNIGLDTVSYLYLLIAFNRSLLLLVINLIYIFPHDKSLSWVFEKFSVYFSLTSIFGELHTGM